MQCGKVVLLCLQNMLPLVGNTLSLSNSLKSTRGFLKIFDGILFSAYVLFNVAMFINDSDTSRSLYCVSLILCYTYFMKMLIVSKRIGPKIYMIRLMVCLHWYFILVMFQKPMHHSTIFTACMYIHGCLETLYRLTCPQPGKFKI